MDIDQIIDHIAVYEDSILNELSVSVIQTLMALYQKAIEYYSAFDNDRFNDFLNRMHELLKREDIQIVLSSLEEETKHQEQELLKNAKEEAEKVEKAKAEEKKKIFQIASDDDANDDAEEGEEYYDSEEDSPTKIVS